MGAAGLGGEGAGLPGGGRGRLFGAFRKKRSTRLGKLDGTGGARQPLTSANHVWASASGSTLGLGGSHCQQGQTVPLGRGGGHELPSWAVEMKQI